LHKSKLEKCELVLILFIKARRFLGETVKYVRTLYKARLSMNSALLDSLFRQSNASSLILDVIRFTGL